MTIQERKKSLKNLGEFLSQFSPSGILKSNNIPYNEPFFDVLSRLTDRLAEQNAWFTRKNVLYALQTWAEALKEDKINQWFSRYNIQENKQPKTVGVVMAGNIPLVGFHDFISVLASGNRIKAKLSSNDKLLLPLLAKYLMYINEDFKDKIIFEEKYLTDIDAVIATGSDNTSRYFEFYFGKYPHIIRRNRNSVAVLTGMENEKELEGLADDIMLYFGLGCRNVSKLFVPENYDFNLVFKALLKYKDLIHYRKYANNYDYNKAVYLMSVDKEVKDNLLDNGLVLFKKDYRYASPIGTLFYEYYKNLSDVQQILENDKNKIQAVVSHLPELKGSIPFGTTQKPELWDYADGVDTMEFLLNL
jgi:hypothetical protein